MEDNRYFNVISMSFNFKIDLLYYQIIKFNRQCGEAKFFVKMINSR